jgi:beta-glucosidase
MRFPDGFIWGAATSAIQIEGATREDGRGPSIWDAFAAKPGNIKNGDTPAVACDHYHRFAEDLDILAGAGFNAYRFSIAWPRVQPEGRGKPNPKGIGFYDKLVDAMLARGIEPWATLYHWDLPLALGEAGGWLERDTAKRFADYCEICALALGDRIKRWATLNEPFCSAFLGYGMGAHAPGHRDMAESVRAAHRLLLAHGLAIPRIRELCPSSSLGIVLNPSLPLPTSDSEADGTVAKLMGEFASSLYLEPLLGKGYPESLDALFPREAYGIEEGDMEVIAAPIDWIGVNYYHEMVVRAEPANPQGGFAIVPPLGKPVTGLGWEIVPEGLVRILRWVAREAPGMPLYVTENGAAFPDRADLEAGVCHDPDRVAYLASHLEACGQAIEEGLPLKGYFVWSLLDNFEWAEGYSQRFGLVYVDYPSQRRIPKESLRFMSQVIRGSR